MAFLQGKTPISFLQELCTKRGITPQYDLIANEGAVHEPTFVFKVVAGEHVGTGKGPSKKKAKHNSAVSILNQMMGVGDGQTLLGTETPGSGSSVSGESAGDDNLGNPVGELQEMTQKRLWPPPVYDYTNEQGPPHAREFICTVRLHNLEEKGVGKSKKVAKRNAALTMIQLLKQGVVPPAPETETEPEVQYDPDSLPLPADEFRDAYSLLKAKKLPTLTPQAGQQISQFYSDLQANAGKALQDLQRKLLSRPEVNYIEMLQDIAKQQKFEVTYVDISEPTQSGASQCLVQLSVLPVAVCHGVAQTKDAARRQAAVNALQYLKIMAKAPRKA